MKPTLVSSRTINEINNMIRNSKTLKERYKISLYINVFFFVILLIGLFVLYKRYKSNSAENKTNTVKQFYNNVNKLYQQQHQPSQQITTQQLQPLSNNNIISHTQQSHKNSNKSLRFDELLPPPINTFNGDVPIQPLPNQQQPQSNYNSSPSQNCSQNAVKIIIKTIILIKHINKQITTHPQLKTTTPPQGFKITKLATIHHRDRIKT